MHWQVLHKKNKTMTSTTPASTGSVIKKALPTTPHNNMMYGDIVIGLWWSIVVPFHGKDLWEMSSGDPLLPAAKIVYGGIVAGFVVTWSAVLSGWVGLSRLAMLANIFAMSATGYYEWPFPGECAITPMMVGGTVLGVLANLSLSYEEKMIRLPLYFAAGSYVCHHSEYCDYQEDTRPILGGTVLLEMLLLVAIQHGGGLRRMLHRCLAFVYGGGGGPHDSSLVEQVAGEFNVAHLARIVLACIFLHHVASTLLQIGNSGGSGSGNSAIMDLDAAMMESTTTTPPPVAKQFFLLVQASLVAVVGVAATGAFQEEINSKQRAEKKAKEEAMMSKAMADSMTALTHELRTPLQGIMGATSMLLNNKNEKDNDNDDKDRDESLKLIMASSGLLINLINNMLDVKRVAEGMMEEFPLTLIPANEPIRDAIGFCLPLASISNVNIVQDYGQPTTEHAVVKSNALRLQQVLINLLSNAIKYTNAGAGDGEDGDDDDAAGVVRVSLRITTVDDCNDRMLRALASSSSSSSRRRDVAAAAWSSSGESNDPHHPHNDTTTASSSSSTKMEDGSGRSEGHDDDPHHKKWSEKRGNEKVLVFGVSDGGPGIDRVQANKLFRRFGRLADNKPKRALGGNKVGQPSGTGLGLHLCELFVKRMDGQIWATNNHPNNDDDGRRPAGGGGATFFFCLPLGLEGETKFPGGGGAERPPKLPLRPAAARRRSSVKPIPIKNLGILRSIEEKGSRDGSGKRSPFASLLDNDGDNDTTSSMISPLGSDRISVFERRVLVVDDTMINRKILGRMLKQIGLSKLKTVDSGRAALNELYKERYDLVITDLQMPNMNGMELTQAIHDIEDEFFKTPVVVGLTADTTSETVEECKDSGMADVIHKPITVEELRDFFERKISVLIEQNETECLEP